MKTSSILILFIICLFFPLCHAQEIEGTVSLPYSQLKNLQEENQNYKIKIDSLTNLKEEWVIKFEQTENDLNVYKNREEEYLIKLKNSEQDIVQLKNQIKSLNDLINSLQETIKGLDNVKLRYANGRLELPYDQDRIYEAITLFNEISDENLKNNYPEIKFLLNNYEKYNKQLISLIRDFQVEVQNLSDIKFVEWQNNAISRINTTEYAKYKKSKPNTYRIKYLDNIITELSYRIKNASKPTIGSPTPTVLFDDLILRLSINNPIK